MSRGTPNQRSVAELVSVMLFFATALASLNVAIYTADQTVLRWAYGPDVVAREQLRIVSHKPVLRVSNGDQLEEWAGRHFLLTGPIWWSLFAGAFLVPWLLLPKDIRRMINQASPDKKPAGCFTARVVPTLILLIFLPWSAVAYGLLVLVALEEGGQYGAFGAGSVACGLVVLGAIAVAWLTKGRPDPPSD